MPDKSCLSYGLLALAGSPAMMPPRPPARRSCAEESTGIDKMAQRPSTDRKRLLICPSELLFGFAGAGGRSAATERGEAENTLAGGADDLIDDAHRSAQPR